MHSLKHFICTCVILEAPHLQVSLLNTAVSLHEMKLYDNNTKGTERDDVRININETATRVSFRTGYYLSLIHI